MPWPSGSFGSPQDTRDQLALQADSGEKPQRERERGQEDTDQGSLTLSSLSRIWALSWEKDATLAIGGL